MQQARLPQPQGPQLRVQARPNSQCRQKQKAHDDHNKAMKENTKTSQNTTGASSLTTLAIGLIYAPEPAFQHDSAKEAAIQLHI
jgi:hypothetical protein